MFQMSVGCNKINLNLFKCQITIINILTGKINLKAKTHSTFFTIFIIVKLSPLPNDKWQIVRFNENNYQSRGILQTL